MQPRVCVAEKWSLTNRIRRHFARIKAAAAIVTNCGYYGKDPYYGKDTVLGKRPGVAGDAFQEAPF